MIGIGSFMSLNQKPVSQSTAVEIGGDLTSALHNLNTLDVAASGTLNLTNVRAVNFIQGGVFVLQSSTLVTNQLVLFISTGAIGAVRMSLSNGGTIAGSSVYTLQGPKNLSFDGTNLS
jgi:hypothetical protein